MPEEVRADLLLGRDTLSPGLIKAGRAASDASSNVRQLTRDLYEAGKTRATPVVDLNDAAATAKLADVSQKLRDLGARVANPEINLDDKAAASKIADMRVKLDALGRKVSSPRVTLDGVTRAEAQVLKLDLMLDELSRKHATPSVSTSRGGILSRLTGFFGGGGADVGGVAGAGGGLPALGGVAGIGALIAAALALAPAAIPFALGGGVGLGGGALAGALGIKGLAALQTDKQAVAQALASIKASTAPGTASASQLLSLRLAQQQLAKATTPAQRAAAQASILRAQTSIASTTAPGTASQSQILSLRQAQQQLAKDQARFGGFVPFGSAVTGLGNTALSTFLGALTGSSPGFSAGPHGQPGGSFLSGLTPIFKQLQGFVKSIGPQLGDLFRSSLPFVSAFVKILEQFAKAVLPAITQSLKIMAPDLPILVQGFKLLSEGIAGFLINLGPGMKDSAIIFKGAMELVKGILQLVGAAASTFAIAIVQLAEFIRTAARDIPQYFDKMRHDIATIFDGLRHDIATIWDQIFTFAKDAVTTGISNIVGFFKALPSKILAAMFGLGHSLYAFGHAALDEFLSGLKAVGTGILGWLDNFWHSIIGVAKKILGVFSPSTVFFDIGKNLMMGLEGGIKAHAQNAVNAAKSAAQRAAGAGAHGGPTSASASQAQAYARSRLAAFGWGAGEMAPLIALWNQESGWNRFARNPTSGAYGIPQALPPGKMGAAANPPTSSAAAQINWGLGYIKSVYGSPANAEAHELAHHWYDKGGWLPTGASIAVNNTGRPEMVLPNGGAAAQVVIEVRGNDSDTSQFLVRLLKRHVRVAGGGNVQTAFTTSR